MSFSAKEKLKSYVEPDFSFEVDEDEQSLLEMEGNVKEKKLVFIPEITIPLPDDTKT